jgi:hypothetical protein
MWLSLLAAAATTCRCDAWTGASWEADETGTAHTGRAATAREATPLDDATKYEAKDELLAALRDAQTRLTAGVERFDERRLDDPFPDPSYRDVFPTIRHALTQVLAGHAAFHVGQISAWRRAMGPPPMTRGFE